MAVKKRKVALRLETLEDRMVPASIQYLGSEIIINNTVGAAVPTITVSTTGSNTTVTAGSTLTFGGSGMNIIIKGANNNAVYNLSKLNNFTGDLTLTTGNGSDSIVLGGSGAAGNANVIYGNGADTLTLAAGYMTNGSVQFTGTSAAGNSAFTTNGVYIGGNLTVTNARVSLGADTVGGMVTVNDGQVSSNIPVAIGAAQIGNGLSVTTGNGSDSVTLNGTTVNGNAGIYEGIYGSGNNLFSTTGTVLITGNLNFQTGSGSNTETVGVNSGDVTTVQGSANFTVGNGADVFTTNGNFSVYTSFLLTAGNTNLTASIGGSINGPATLNLGNGTDSVLLTASVGGTLNWTSGSGLSDTLTISPATGENYKLNVNFNNGGLNNTLNLSGNDTVTGTVFMGVNGTFNQNSATIGSPFSLSF